MLYLLSILFFSQFCTRSLVCISPLLYTILYSYSILYLLNYVPFLYSVSVLLSAVLYSGGLLDIPPFSWHNTGQYIYAFSTSGVIYLKKICLQITIELIFLQDFFFCLFHYNNIIRKIRPCLKMACYFAFL
jgi:hypothetical protein